MCWVRTLQLVRPRFTREVSTWWTSYSNTQKHILCHIKLNCGPIIIIIIIKVCKVYFLLVLRGESDLCVVLYCPN